MPDRVEVHIEEWMRDAVVAARLTRFMRRQADRVREQIRAPGVAPFRTGELRERLRTRAGVDSQGPYAFISTRARNPETGYRYGLALEQKLAYLEKGLRRTPRE